REGARGARAGGGCARGSRQADVVDRRGGGPGADARRAAEGGARAGGRARPDASPGGGGHGGDGGPPGGSARVRARRGGATPREARPLGPSPSRIASGRTRATPVAGAATSWSCRPALP